MTLRTTSMPTRWIAISIGALLGCAADDDGDDTGAGTHGESTAPAETTAPTTTSAADTSSGSDSGGMGDGSEAHEMLARLPGLWIGPVDSTTSAGDFPTMNMDVRPVDGHTLFSRVDLDGGNSLRFAFAIEEHEGPVLTFRNGGYFLGIMRDSRTTLVEVDLVAERWRFCSIDQGCEYISAVFDFEGPDSLAMHVDVRDKTHFDWPATRAELREIDGPFPADDGVEPGDQPFPEMPTLAASLSWTTPLEADSDAWVILSTTNCGLTGGCVPSRFIHGTATAGSTSLDLVVDQIHAGDYKANAILDRNGTLASTFSPDSGDSVSIPNSAVSVAATGTTEISLLLAVDL
jgi:hypothetical protein